MEESHESRVEDYRILPNWLIAFLVMLQAAFSARRDAQMRFLKLQVEFMKKRLPGNRAILDPDERQRLMVIGGELKHAVHDVLSIVTVKTYRRWQREEKADKAAKKVGRPQIAKSLRDMIVKLAKENSWGILRIMGELKKLALKASSTTIRRVLRAEKLLPDPNRHAPKGVDTPWRKFVAVHMNVMVACDFLTKAVWSPLGKKTQAYVLAFIHLGSRKVFLSPSTYHPTGEWVQQQARNASMWAEEEGIDIRFLIHDRDTKFTEAFDEHFKRDDGGPVITPPFSPRANCYCESWIGNYKREVLNHIFCFCLWQLDYVCKNYASYFNNFRPHQGLDNCIPGHQTLNGQTSNNQTPDSQLLNGQSPSGHPPDAQAAPSPPLETEINIKLIKRTSWLGGLLRHYERKAA